MPVARAAAPSIYHFEVNFHSTHVTPSLPVRHKDRRVDLAPHAHLPARVSRRPFQSPPPDLHTSRLARCHHFWRKTLVSSTTTTATRTEGQEPDTGATLPSFALGSERDVSTRVGNGVARVKNGSMPVTAHELHNLIAVIIAEAQLLQLDHPTDAPKHQSAVAIERAGRRLETLIDKLPVDRGTTHVPSVINRDRPTRQIVEQVGGGAEG